MQHQHLPSLVLSPTHDHQKPLSSLSPEVAAGTVEDCKLQAGGPKVVLHRLGGILSAM